ncbi:hypothetical protein [Nocardia sp. NPDC051832]|uniref:hypothetical protein n=1 Tax=Nocardia sp. NPDC051832 TaxID=3155673 RepID=UPI00343FE140
MKTLPRLTKSKTTADDELLAGELATRVQTARERMAHQFDPALIDALSERELHADRALAEGIRDHKRNEDLSRIQSAAAAAERLRKTTARLADQEAADLVTARAAIAEQRRKHSPHARLAWLHRRRNWVLRGLMLLMVAAMIFSAVTVQQNIAPGLGPANLMWWLSYTLELFISGMLIAIAISASDTDEFVADRPDAHAEMRKVRAAEIALLTTTLGLNIYPYVRSGDLYNTAVHAMAPLSIGAALVVHEAASRRYGRAIERVTASITDTESDITVRLAELARLTDLPASEALRGEADAVHHRAERIDVAAAALEPRPAAVDYDTDQFPIRDVLAHELDAMRDARTTAGSEPAPTNSKARTAGTSQPAPRTSAGAPHPAPAVDPAPAARTRTGAGAGPAPETGDDQAAETIFAAEQTSELPMMQARTETPHLLPAAPEPVSAARTSVTSPAEPAPAPADTEPAPAYTNSAPVAAVRPRTSPHQPAPASADSVPTIARTKSRTSASTAAAIARQPEWMSPIVDLAAEVKARGVAKSKPVETVAAVITAIDANESNNAIAKTPTTKMSHSTVESIRQAVAEIRHEQHRGTGGRVIELRKQGI